MCIRDSQQAMRIERAGVGVDLGVFGQDQFVAPAALAQSDDLRPRTPAANPVTGNDPVDLTGADRDQAITRANTSLNALQRLQGRFTQTSPTRTVSTGAFYLQRPGKVRFEYDPPATLLIVSDGSVVSMRNSAMRTTDRTPLRSTPLNMILKSQIDLNHDARISRVARWGQYTICLLYTSDAADE